MIGSPGQALSAFSASARKPSVRRGLAKAWARVLVAALGSAGGSGLSKSVFAGWSGIGALRGGDVLLSRLANPNLRRRNSPGRSTLAWRHSPRVNKFFCAPSRQSPQADDLTAVEFWPRSRGYAFFAHPVETISRPFSAAFGPRVSKSTFGGTGVSDCTVLGNHLSVLTSPSEAAILHRNEQGSCDRRVARSTELWARGWNRKGWT